MQFTHIQLFPRISTTKPAEPKRLCGLHPTNHHLLCCYLNNCRNCWGDEFACDNWATPICCRMLSFVTFTCSNATSASMIRLRDASMFVIAVFRFSSFTSRRCINEPIVCRASSAALAIAVRSVSVTLADVLENPDKIFRIKSYLCFPGYAYKNIYQQQSAFNCYPKRTSAW